MFIWQFSITKQIRQYSLLEYCSTVIIALNQIKRESSKDALNSQEKVYRLLCDCSKPNTVYNSHRQRNPPTGMCVTVCCWPPDPSPPLITISMRRQPRVTVGMIVAKEWLGWRGFVFDLGFDDSGSQVGAVQVCLEDVCFVIEEFYRLCRVFKPLGRASSAEKLWALNHDAAVDTEELFFLANKDVELLGKIESDRYSQRLVLSK